MKRVVLVFLALLSFADSEARGYNRHEGAISVGLDNNDAYEIELSYRYFLMRYVAIGIGVGYYQQYDHDNVPSGTLEEDKWTSWRLADDDIEIRKAYLSPSVTLRTPTLLAISKAKLSLEGEAGLKMQIPTDIVSVDYYNVQTYDRKRSVKLTGKGNWCFWETKGLLRLGFPKLALSLGYSLSNLDIYTNYRKMEVEHVPFSSFYPKRKMTHSFFLKMSFPM